VELNLKSGKTAFANVAPKLPGVKRGVLTAGEFGDIVNAMVDAVEDPDERSLCG
jgi:hypothetical protein